MSNHYKNLLNKELPNRKFIFAILGVLIIIAVVFIFTNYGQQLLTFLLAPEKKQIPLVEKPIDKVAQAKNVTKRLLSLRREYHKAPSSKKREIMNSMMKLSQTRKEILSSLIEKNPREFLKFSIPLEIRESFPSQVKINLEEEASLEGSFSVLIVDTIEPPESKMLYFLRVGATKFSLYPTEQLPLLLSGTKVNVSGVMLGDKIALDSNEKESFQIKTSVPGVLGALASENGSALGEQRLAVILVNFQDNTNQPVTKAQVQNELSTKIDPYYQEVSYNKLSIPGDVFGWYTLPITYQCEPEHFGLIQVEALKAADPEINFQNYKHIIYAVPSSSSICGFGGIASGTETFPGPNIPYTSPDGEITVTHAWMSAQYLSNVAHIAAHELGHNLGDILEGDAWDCGPEVIGVRVQDGGNCTHIGYGDLFDVMGVATLGHFNAYHKETFGWLDSSNIITVTTSGTYTIEPFETATAGPKIIKIPRDKDGTGKTISWLYLEFRQLLGFDKDYNFWLSYSPNPTNGALIHYPYPIRPWPSWPDLIAAYTSYLLDTTPESQSNEVYDRSDSALEVGKTFTDSAYGITIRTVSKTASSLSVEINLGQPPICTRANPTVAITPASQSSAPGETLTYNISVTNNDNGCDPATFSLTPSVPSGWSSSLASNELTINPVSSASTSLSVTSAASASEDLYNVSVGASNKAAPTYTGSASATYIVFIPNRPPVLASIGNKTVDEGQLLEFTISATDPDSDTLTYSVINLPDGANFDPMTQIFSWQPNFNQAGNYEITFAITDGELYDEETINIIVKEAGEDSDNDGFIDAIEQYIGTDPLDACPDDKNDPAWPPDINNDRSVDILDVLMYKPKLAPAPYDKRYDLNTDGSVNILDVLLFKQYLWKSCTNP